jgi:hypothetical protein
MRKSYDPTEFYEGFSGYNTQASCFAEYILKLCAEPSHSPSLKLSWIEKACRDQLSA